MLLGREGDVMVEAATWSKMHDRLNGNKPQDTFAFLIQQQQQQQLFYLAPCSS